MKNSTIFFETLRLGTLKIMEFFIKVNKRSKRITNTRGMACKKFVKLKMLEKEIITPRNSYQAIVQEVISSLINIDTAKQ